MPRRNVCVVIIYKPPWGQKSGERRLSIFEFTIKTRTIAFMAGSIAYLFYSDKRYLSRSQDGLILLFAHPLVPPAFRTAAAPCTSPVARSFLHSQTLRRCILNPSPLSASWAMQGINHFAKIWSKHCLTFLEKTRWYKTKLIEWGWQAAYYFTGPSLPSVQTAQNWLLIPCSL